jgi:hypothetical protein
LTARNVGLVALFVRDSCSIVHYRTVAVQEIFDVSNGKLPAYLSALTEPEGGRVEQKQTSGKR